MATLPVYQPTESTNVQPLRGSDPGAAAAVGRAISGFGGSLKEIGDKINRHDEMVESSALAANAATIEAYHSIQWQKFKQQADPTDPEFHNLGQRFMDEVVNPNIEALGQNISTPAGKADYEVTAAKMRSNMLLKVTADQAQLTGEAVTQDAITVRNSTSTGIFNDPTSFQAGLDTAASERLRLQRAGMPAGEALKWETETQAQFAEAAVHGAAKLNTDKARSDLESGKYDKYISGTQKAQLEKVIEAQETANRVAKTAAEEEAQRQAKLASTAALNGHVTKFTADDLNPVKAITAINNDPNMLPADKGEAVRLLEVENTMRGAPARLAREAASAGREAAAAARAAADHAAVDADRKASQAVMQRITAPVGDPTRITEPQEIFAEVKDGGLSVTRANALITTLNTVRNSLKVNDGYAAQYAEFHRATRQDITHGLSSREGDYQNFVDYTEPLIQKGLKDGKTAAQLFDKDSPDYVGKGYKQAPITAATLADKPAPGAPAKSAFSSASLDKIEHGAAGSAAGIAALKASGLSREAMKREAIARGWVAP